ncbi:MAG TPA: NAD(P)-dependent oxidoreductase [bacterium]|jgi:UDP-glucose 4-epimerase|nr:NAD(P)-dependent oxidoreductase [bacterium]
MSRKRILLTGGSGFIGRNILASPLALEHEFVSPGHAELDLCDTDAVDAYFRSRSFDCVIHGAVKPGHRAARDTQALLQSNTRMFFNLARHVGRLERLIVLGSGAIYDSARCEPRTPEENFGLRIPADEHGFTKYLCGKAGETSDRIVDLRIFGIFGPWEDYSIRFISNLICKAQAGLPLTVKQDRRMDFLWVQDLVPVLGRFISHAPAQSAYNVTPDETASLLDLAGRVRALSGKDLEIRVAKDGLGPEYSGDNTRLKRELPGFKPTPFDVSLPLLYRWYAEHPDLVERERLLNDL